MRGNTCEETVGCDGRLTRVWDDPEVYRLVIDLPGYSMGHVNCYLVKESSECLLVDSGLGTMECRDMIIRAFGELGVDPAQTSVLVTHCHDDHIGGMGLLAPYMKSCYAGEVEVKDFLRLSSDPESYCLQDMVAQGMSRDTAEWIISLSVQSCDASVLSQVTLLNDGDEIALGSLHFRALMVPGHTTGHLCYYCPENGLLFSGDHIILSMSPSLCYKSGGSVLRDYFAAMDRLAELQVSCCFPGHGLPFDGGRFKNRVHDLASHQQKRLDDIRAALETASVEDDNTGFSGVEIAQRIPWRGVSDGYRFLTRSQTHFANTEVLTHLEYLEEQGIIERFQLDSKLFYRLVGL